MKCFFSIRAIMSRTKTIDSLVGTKLWNALKLNISEVYAINFFLTYETHANPLVILSYSWLFVEDFESTLCNVKRA